MHCYFAALAIYVIYASASLEYVIYFVNFAFGCVHFLYQIYLATLQTVVAHYHSFAIVTSCFH